MFQNIAKDAGSEAASTIKKTVEEAIPAVEQTGKNLEDHATYAVAGIVADVFNRLRGTKLPVDLTIEATLKVKITGQIGALEVGVPEYEVSK